MSLKNTVNSLSNGSDVSLNSPIEGQVLTYSNITGKWTNQSIASTAIGVVRVVKNADNTWPVRPAGVSYVEWVGPGSPDPPYTNNGDSWVDTSQ